MERMKRVEISNRIEVRDGSIRPIPSDGEKELIIHLFL